MIRLSLTPQTQCSGAALHNRKHKDILVVQHITGSMRRRRVIASALLAWSSACICSRYRARQFSSSCALRHAPTVSYILGACEGKAF